MVVLVWKDIHTSVNKRNAQNAKQKTVGKQLKIKAAKNLTQRCSH